MYKYLILLKILTTDSHTDVVLKGGEKLVIEKANPHYEYCVEALSFALERNKPVGAIIAEGGIIVDVIRSRTGVVSSIDPRKDARLAISMLPLDGIYSLYERNPAYERLRLIVMESQQKQKKVHLFLRPGVPTDILDVRFAE